MGLEWIWSPPTTEHDRVRPDISTATSRKGHGQALPARQPGGPEWGNRLNLTYEFIGVTRVWRWTKVNRMIEAHRQGPRDPSRAWSRPRPLEALPRRAGQGTPGPMHTWTDILPVQPMAAERLGYPTQKPEALLERILQASSNEGRPGR
ncbi:MAG: hypothetical protein M0C28_02905 [Candidatus Moduliflexus flocculans]|nr:hypothetical protein [Candidatus Moduliflexus flocculans]